MRILLISHYYAPEIGAPQRRWSSLVGEWRALGHEVTVLTSMPHYPHPDLTADMRAGTRPYRRETGEFGETVIRMPFLPHGRDVLTRTLDHAFVSLQSLVVGMPRAGSRFDVVITTVPALTSLFVGHVAARILRVPLVVEMRDAWPDLVTFTPGIAPGKGITGLLRGLTHRLVTRLQLGSHQVVTTSARFAGVLTARGVEAVTVIRNGADLTRTPDLGGDRAAERRGLRRQREAPGCPPAASGPDRGSAAPVPGDDAAASAPERSPGTLRILYLGTLGRSQGLAAVIDAAGMAAAGGVHVQLRFVGAGAEREALQERARESLATITFLDPVPHREVGEHYRWADTVAVSLRDWAPFRWTVPSKLYELLATNRHVSALVAGESAEIIRDARAGFVAAPGDAKALARHWMEVAADRSLLDHGGAGRRWAAAHTDIKDLSSLYLRLLEAAHREGRRARALPPELRGSTEGPRASEHRAAGPDPAEGEAGRPAATGGPTGAGNGSREPDAREEGEYRDAS
ncbi:glycosyltransferase family 4 protein [Rothia halotolerans]|uniref:glycosyltransferase family 4 protein n=1 Tax=Rothia halotolerans TaxID=405770 RepID=UPI00101CDBFE|nr:glycosyltransferase family 4 protein [Rothia halotolerans]